MMAVAQGQGDWRHTVLVGSSWSRARFEKYARYLEVTIRGGKVQRSRSFGARAAGRFALETRRVDVCAVVNEHAHSLFAPTRTRCMKRKDAVEVAVGQLSVFQRELDQTNVAGCCRAVQAKIGMCAITRARGTAETALADRLERRSSDGTLEHGGLGWSHAA